jgi:hypothetical protein
MRVHVGLLFLGLLAYAPAWAGCTARLYNLDSGEITPLKCSHRHRTTGTVSGTMASGEKLSGEYVTVVNSAVGWGSIYSGVYSASGVSAAVAGKNQGSAVMTGDKGTVLNCEYISSGGHGTGACKDKRGTKYKLMF